MTAVELTISEHLREILPVLSVQQYKRIEAAIIADGEVTEAIYYWNDGTANVIVYGVEQFQIAKAHGLEYRVKQVEFPDIQAAKVWMLHRLLVKNILTRRQLSYVIGSLYNLVKGKRGGDRTSTLEGVTK